MYVEYRKSKTLTRLVRVLLWRQIAEMKMLTCNIILCIVHNFAYIRNLKYICVCSLYTTKQLDRLGSNLAHTQID